MDSPKVSVIIPVYNPGEYFTRCLDSVANQTLKDIEVICIDDGSTDSSVEILNEYSQKDPRFKVFHQENSGAGMARNRAIDMASGEYIIFVDADDWIEEEMCEKLYNHAKSLDVDLVLFDAMWYYQDETLLVKSFDDNEFRQDYRTYVFDRSFIYEKIFVARLGVIWSKFYKTSYIKENNIRFSTYKIYNDIVFHFKSMLLTNRIAYYPEAFYHYLRIGQPSLQTSFTGGAYEPAWFCVMIEIRDFLKKHYLMDQFRKKYLNYCFIYSDRKFRDTSPEHRELFFEKLKYFYESLELTPKEFSNLRLEFKALYIHMITSSSCKEFEAMQSRFDGRNL